ncbi:MAG: DUF1501 domain-containing protein [Zavarzinella sp.]
MFSRRHFLQSSGAGFGSLVLPFLLQAEDRKVVNHHPAKAKRVVQLFMAGAASHVDLFDYKPELEKHHGKPWNPGEKVELFQSTPGSTFASPWKFRQYGKSGKWLSEIAAPLGDVVDEMAFIHNLVGKTGVHSQGTFLQATGFQSPGFPGMGCWISYGLGSLNQQLPTFVVLPDHRGFASNGSKNWDAAFLPAEHQGTIIRPGNRVPIDNIQPADTGKFVTPAANTAGIDLLSKLNAEHAKTRTEDSRLESRIASYELAAQMQLAAPEALDLTREPKSTWKHYGIEETPPAWPAEINTAEETDHLARKCITARRLLERGVRFVQIWSGCDNGFPRRNWDSHEDIARDHGPLGLGMARAVRSFIQDLKRTGLLEETIVLWTTEFGRMPCAQGGKGRDHNPFCFTNWLCGGGIKGGTTFGESDVWGFKPAEPKKATQVYDVHATILHLLGIDHTRFTVRQNGIDRRLTDVHGHVVKDLL